MHINKLSKVLMKPLRCTLLPYYFLLYNILYPSSSLADEVGTTAGSQKKL